MNFLVGALTLFAGRHRSVIDNPEHIAALRSRGFQPFARRHGIVGRRLAAEGYDPIRHHACLRRGRAPGVSRNAWIAGLRREAVDPLWDRVVEFDAAFGGVSGEPVRRAFW